MTYQPSTPRWWRDEYGYERIAADEPRGTNPLVWVILCLVVGFLGGLTAGSWFWPVCAQVVKRWV